jgi:VWFA-related protein
MGNERGNQRIRGSRVALTLLGAMFLLAGLLAPAGPARAADVDSLRLSQVCAINPDFFAFVEVLDADGNMVKNVRNDQLTSILGTQALKINNLMDFSQADSGVAYILLVDISKSLSAKEFASMRQVLQGWIDGMSERDRAAIITFGTKVEKLQDFSSDKSILKDLIAQLKSTDKDTQLHAGLIRAMELGSRADPDLPTRRVIITLSDGQDDFAGGATPKEVFDMMKTDPVPIYAIGYYRAPRKPKKEEALKSLGAFARTSGGSYFRAEANTIPEMFTRMRQKIMEVYEVKFIWPEGKWDGAPQHLQMTYKEGPKVLNADMDMRLRASTKVVIAVDEDLDKGKKKTGSEEVIPVTFWEKTQAFWASIYPWGYVGGGLLLLGIIIAIIIMASTQKGDRMPPQAIMDRSGPEAEGGVNPYKTVYGPSGQTPPVVMPWKPAAPGKAGPGKQLRFTVVRGEENRPPYEVNLTDRLVIGRADNCDVPLTDDKEVSRNHCELTLEDEVIRIADLGSKNGTLINGVPISGSYQLQNDDIILVGRTELRVTLG